MFLEMDGRLIYGRCYSDILRAISDNKTVKSVVFRQGSLESLTKVEEEFGVILRMISDYLYNIETLSICIPKKLQQQQSCSRSMMIDSLIYSVAKDSKTLKCLEIRGLKLESEEERRQRQRQQSDVLLLHEALNLQELRFIDLSFETDDDGCCVAGGATFLESLHRLPNLQELEIRLSAVAVAAGRSGNSNTGSRRNNKLPDNFFHLLLNQSKLIKSLILENIQIDSVQVSHILEPLENNKCTLQRIEFWDCNLDVPILGTLLGSMILKNRTLHTLTVSNIKFYDGIIGVLQFLTAMKTNSTLKHLRLLVPPIGSSTSVKDHHHQLWTEAACKLMMKNNNNRSLKSITFQC